jgi:hypothetical protein
MVGRVPQRLFITIKSKRPRSRDEIPEAEVPTKEAKQQPRRSGRARQRPERLGADTRDPDVPWIP